MKNRKRALSILTCGLLLANLLCGCKGGDASGGSASASSGTDGTQTPASASSGTSGAAQTAASGVSGEAPAATASVVFGADGAAVSGEGASYADGVLTVTESGVYAISGSTQDGRILVDAPDAAVTLLLEGADIACPDGAALYVYDADSVTLWLADGSENVLSDGESYAFDGAQESEADEEPNACVYAKDDLVIAGTGALTVNGNYNNGITCKDTLVIGTANVTVNAVNHGVNGKDSLTVTGAGLTVTAGGDAVRSTNDSDETLGWITVEDSTLDLTSGEDGIQAETVLTLRGGSCKIVSGGGSGGTLSADQSAKGLKAGTQIVLESGSYDLDCLDDAVHSNGDALIAGGEFVIATGDDGVHADNAVQVSGGTITITACYEGLEGLTVDVSGGEIDITASDDGINAAGGADQSGFGFGFGNFGGMTPPDGTDGNPPELPDGETMTPPDGNPPEMPGSDGSTPSMPGGETGNVSTNGEDASPDGASSGFTPDSFASGSDACITISGGVIRIDAGGDGIDSNGDLVVTGGEVYVSGPTSDGDSALDYDGTASVSGGVFIAAGSSGMAMNFGSGSTQGSILVNLGGRQSGEISLTDADGNVLASWTPAKEYASVVVSCAGITDGGTYTVQAGGASQTVTMSGLIYGAGMSMPGQGGGFGGQGGPGGKRP